MVSNTVGSWRGYRTSTNKSIFQEGEEKIGTKLTLQKILRIGVHIMLLNKLIHYQAHSQLIRHSASNIQSRRVILVTRLPSPQISMSAELVT